MVFCSLDEAFGQQQPHGIDQALNDSDNYSAVSYEDSNIYNCDGKSSDTCKSRKCPKKIPNMSRTNERLVQHSGPMNRYKNGEKNVVLTYDKNNKMSYSKDVVNNNEVPISAYSKKIKSHRSYSTPVHDIMMRSQSIMNDNAPDLNDTVDTILNSENSSVSSSKSLSNNSTEIRIRNKIVKKRDSNKNLVEDLLNKNRNLELKLKSLEKKLKKSGEGIFTSTDLLVVGVLGIIMLIVLQVVFKIALHFK